MANIGRNALDAGTRRIEVTAAVRVGWISLAVTDDGPGIPGKARERLFQPFVGSGKADGSGLGLAIARERMHAHGGEIQLVENKSEERRVGKECVSSWRFQGVP